MADVIKLTSDEQEALQKLLKSEKLCYNDINESGVQLYGVKIKHVTVGYFGFEVFDNNALFRSLLVQPDARKRGYGTAIWQASKEKLAELGVNSVFLLTDADTQDFFLKLGFEIFKRDEVPVSIANTTEFKDFCPDSSICMKTTIL